MQFNNENMKIEYGGLNIIHGWDKIPCNCDTYISYKLDDSKNGLIIVCNCDDKEDIYVWHRCWSSPQIGGKTVYNERKKLLDEEYNRIISYF